MAADEAGKELERMSSYRDGIDASIERLVSKMCPPNYIDALYDLRREVAVEIGKLLGATCSGP